MSRKEKICPELRKAASKLNEILDWGEEFAAELGYELTGLERSLLMEHLWVLSKEPLAHRRPVNEIRDTFIAARVEMNIQSGLGKQAAYDATADYIDEKGIPGLAEGQSLDAARIGKIYRRNRNHKAVARHRRE